MKYANSKKIDEYVENQAINKQIERGDFIQSTHYTNIIFDHLLFTYCDFSNLIYEHCIFIKCSFYHCHFKDIDFISNNLSGVEFIDCTFNHVSFHQNKLDYSNIQIKAKNTYWYENSIKVTLIISIFNTIFKS